MVIDILALLEVVQLGAEAVAALQELLTLITGEEQPDYEDLTYEEKLEVLKRCTLMVRRLHLDIACYPLTATSVVFYGPDGEPL